MKKTKIICTLGPSTDKPGILEALIDSGMGLVFPCHNVLHLDFFFF